MTDPTTERPLAARIADDLTRCRQRGLDDLDASMTTHQHPVEAPELDQLAQAYSDAIGLDAYGRAARIRALLRDGLTSYSEHGNEAESQFIESLFFSETHQKPSDLLADAVRAFGKRRDGFDVYRRDAFERFAAFLIEFVQQATARAGQPPATDQVAAPTATPRHSTGYRVGVSVAGFALLAVIVTMVVLLVDSHHQSVNSHSEGTGTHVASGPRYVPGRTYKERTGQFGAPTFTNPFKLSITGPRIQPYTVVRVSCKLYAPTIASASPDGYWYLVASKPWGDRYYAVANTFINGGKVGGPTRATDFKVPTCPS